MFSLISSPFAIFLHLSFFLSHMEYQAFKLRKLSPTDLCLLNFSVFNLWLTPAETFCLAQSLFTRSYIAVNCVSEPHLCLYVILCCWYLSDPSTTLFFPFYEDVVCIVYIYYLSFAHILRVLGRVVSWVGFF